MQKASCWNWKIIVPWLRLLRVVGGAKVAVGPSWKAVVSESFSGVEWFPSGSAHREVVPSSRGCMDTAACWWFYTGTKKFPVIAQYHLSFIYLIPLICKNQRSYTHDIKISKEYRASVLSTSRRWSLLLCTNK